MNIQLHSTTKLVEINGVPARIWEGITESGIAVHAFITRIAIDINESPENVKQFEAELQQCEPPSPDVAAIPLRLII